jgi:hypothetical protein
MNSRLGVSMDPPERVAAELVRLLQGRRRSVVVGWPEKLFVKLNALLPGIVDASVRKQLSIIRHFARRLRLPERPPEKIAAVSTQVGGEVI